MNVHTLDGFRLSVDRGPNWLLVKLQPNKNFARSLSGLADRLLSIASQHFIYRIVLELDEMPALPGELIKQLGLLQKKLAEFGGALRICGLSTECADTLHDSHLDEVLPNHATRQEAVLGSDIAALREKMKEMTSGAGNDGADLADKASIWQQPCMQ